MFKIISLELAKELKEAGLEWKPKENDLVLALDRDGSDLAFHVLPPRVIYVREEDNVWLPTLDQLLDEIEKRGYVPDILTRYNGVYDCYVRRIEVTDTEICSTCRLNVNQESEIIREEAAGCALLFILKGDTNEPC